MAALAPVLHAFAPDQPGSLPTDVLCLQHVEHCGMCCRFLDGRVWPQEDEKQVKLMLAMIHHCTGGSLMISIACMHLCLAMFFEPV